MSKWSTRPRVAKSILTIALLLLLAFVSLALYIFYIVPPTTTATQLEYPLYDDSIGLTNDWIQHLDTILRDSNKFELFTDPRPEQIRDWRVVLSFLHFSDVQIRDHGLRLKKAVPSNWIDTLASGAERVEKLDRNDEFPFIALVGGINRLLAGDGSAAPSILKEEIPRFAIHTGDAIDMSSQGEFLRFVSIANKFSIPWYNVIGNHDIRILGNFKQDKLIVENFAGQVNYFTSVGQFIDWHHDSGMGTFRGDLARGYASHAPTEQGITALGIQPSRFHGFDYKPGDKNGHYSFVVTGADPPIRCIVLQTNVTDEQSPANAAGYGAEGYIDENQFRWLREQLDDARGSGQVVLLFGHHPLSGLSGTHPREGRMLVANFLTHDYNRHVLAYFGGHTHVPAIRQLKARGIVEVIAPSLHELPQAAFLVLLVRKADQLGLWIRPIQGVISEEGPILERWRTAREGSVEEARTAQFEMQKAQLENATEDGRIAITKNTRQFVLIGSSPQSPLDQMDKLDAEVLAEAEVRPSVPIAELIDRPVPRGTEMADLPDMDMESFEIIFDSWLWDLRNVREVPEELKDQPYSPATLVRNTRLRKLRPARSVGFRFATTGVRLDVKCMNRRSDLFHVSNLNQRENKIMYTFHSNVDVSDVPVGESFSVTHENIYWNGFQTPDQWFVVFMKEGSPEKIHGTLIFPKNRLFSSHTLWMFPIGKAKDKRPYPGEALVDREKGVIFWQVRNPLKDHYYRIEWNW